MNIHTWWDQKHFAPNPPESPLLSAPLDTVGNLHHLCTLQLEYVEKKITFGVEIEVTGLNTKYTVEMNIVYIVYFGWVL